MKKMLEEVTHDANFEKRFDVLDKKFDGVERTLDNPKVMEEIQKFATEQTEKWLVNHSEEFVLTIQNLMEKKLLKTDHKN